MRLRLPPRTVAVVVRLAFGVATVVATAPFWRLAWPGDDAPADATLSIEEALGLRCAAQAVASSRSTVWPVPAAAAPVEATGVPTAAMSVSSAR